MSEQSLLDAILEDNPATVKRLLQADRTLATRALGEARLYQAKILHWLYAGDTPLHLAAAGYRVEIIRLLLAAGADPNATMNHRRSGPLHYAADGCLISPAWNEKKQVQTIQCLLEAGAGLDAQDRNGATPLHRAVRTRCAAAVRCLLQAGCDSSRKNNSGSTPFHLAVQNTGRGGSGTENAKAAQRQIIETFLSAGVSVQLKDGKGKSVMDCARSGWIQDLLRA